MKKKKRILGRGMTKFIARAQQSLFQPGQTKHKTES
jgi:hypothetical protein